VSGPSQKVQSGSDMGQPATSQAAPKPFRAKAA
jgi:hypothetical protein